MDAKPPIFLTQSASADRFHVSRRGCFRGIWRLALLLAAWAFDPGPSGAQDTKSFTLDVRDGRLAGGARTLRVTEGDRVELRWTADRPVELHLHGYNAEIHVAPGAVHTMTVDAHTAGRFPVEAHGTGRRGHGNIVYLEVHPR